MSVLQIERVAALQPHSIVLYKSWPNSGRAEVAAGSLAALEKQQTLGAEYNGRMSPATARKVRKYLSTWLLALEQNLKDRGGRGAKYYPTFVTLTLASKQVHDDNYIKRNLLNRFIIRVQKRYGVKYFFWRGEPQENGNLHFHLIVDRFIKWENLRADWNKIQGEHGYIEAYRQAQQQHHALGFTPAPKSKRPLAQQRKAYDEGVACNWSNPNSTDVHKINKLESLSAYVVKYVCKTDKPPPEALGPDGQPLEATGSRRKIKGRIWGCSDELRNFSYYTDTHSIEENFTPLGNAAVIDYCEAVKKEVGPAKVFEDEYITVIRLEKPQHYYLEKFGGSLAKDYRNHYRNIYKQLYEKPAEIPLLEPPELQKLPEEYNPALFGPKIVQIEMFA